MAAYHKALRRYLGARARRRWSRSSPAGAQSSTSRAGSRSPAVSGTADVHEARIAAAKLLTQARIRELSRGLDRRLRWVPAFDAWAIADHACKAIERRLVAEPARLDTVETWTADPTMWVRRAALVATLPWTKARHPGAAEAAARDRILGWAATYASDRDWFIQKAVGCWLRSLAPHDPDPRPRLPRRPRPRSQGLRPPRGRSPP